MTTPHHLGGVMNPYTKAIVQNLSKRTPCTMPPYSLKTKLDLSTFGDTMSEITYLDNGIRKVKPEYSAHPETYKSASELLFLECGFIPLTTEANKTWYAHKHDQNLFASLECFNYCIRLTLLINTTKEELFFLVLKEHKDLRFILDCILVAIRKVYLESR